MAVPATADDLTARADHAELAVYARMPFVPVRGEGCNLFDDAGRRYLDFYGGHAVALTGHCHPKIADAIARQARELLFYSSAVQSRVRVEATELLLRHAPHPDSRVFHCCSGAEANEVAFKIARKSTGRRKIISFQKSFHGRTLGALSAVGLDSYRASAGPVLVPDHVLVPFGDIAALDQAVDGDTAAVICETIQSLAGVYTADAEFFQQAAALTSRRGAVLIFDEVQSGLGRTGTFFFGEGVGVRPDLIALAKGIASGIPSAAVIVAPRLVAGIKMGDHGSTFGGGPVAMAAMRATLEVIEDEGLVENAAKQGHRLLDALPRVPHVREVRGKGLLLGVELDRPAAQVQKSLLTAGLVVGTSAHPHTVRLLPPLTVSDQEVTECLELFNRVMSDA